MFQYHNTNLIFFLATTKELPKSGTKAGKWTVMCMCVRGIYFVFISTIFQLDFGNTPTVSYFLFVILLVQNHLLIQKSLKRFLRKLKDLLTIGSDSRETGFLISFYRVKLCPVKPILVHTANKSCVQYDNHIQNTFCNTLHIKQTLSLFFIYITFF